MISETSSAPHHPRYGTYRGVGASASPFGEIAVQVKAADYNGISFDGCPFSALPEWLLNAIDDKRMLISSGRETDYAEWHVFSDLDDGSYSVASPGDWIIRRENGSLSVVDHEDAFILINLRPPVINENEKERQS